MHQEENGSKCQVFVNKKNMQQPIKVSNLSVTPSGTISFNKGATIQELPSHSMPFQFVKQQSLHTTAISALTKSTSGTFNVYGAIKWKGEVHVPSKKATKQVCDTILTDNTGSIPMSLWGDQITTVQEGNSTHSQNVNCHFYGKCLTTTKATTVSTAAKQDISKAVQQKVQTWIRCLDILNIAVNSLFNMQQQGL